MVRAVQDFENLQSYFNPLAPRVDLLGIKGYLKFLIKSVLIQAKKSSTPVKWLISMSLVRMEWVAMGSITCKRYDNTSRPLSRSLQNYSKIFADFLNFEKFSGRIGRVYPAATA